MAISEKDSKLIGLLREDGRMSIAEVARQLGVSRTAAQARLEKLERNGVIAGFTVQLSRNDAPDQVRALVLIKCQASERRAVEAALNRLLGLTALYSISGEYDMAAVLAAASVGDLDKGLVQISALPGITAVMSSVILGTRFDG